MLQPVSCVILAYNEVEIIEKVVRDFHSKIIANSPGSELIVAEDGSTDGTKEVLARLVCELPALRWEEGGARRGYVNAFKQAMTLPKHELILFCDCSGKHDPDDFWKMIPLMAENDMVLGYKAKRADSWYRLVTSRVFNALVNTYFNIDYKDVNCPMRLFKKSGFLDVAETNWLEEHLINFEFTLRFHYRGYKIHQIPVRHTRRDNGASRGLPLKEIPKVVMAVLRNFPELKNEVTRPNFHSSVR